MPASAAAVMPAISDLADTVTPSALVRDAPNSAFTVSSISSQVALKAALLPSVVEIVLVAALYSLEFSAATSTVWVVFASGFVRLIVAPFSTFAVVVVRA